MYTQALIFPTVVHSTTTETSGSGVFKVLAYNTLTIEIWGPGGPGPGISSTGAFVNGSAGSANTLTVGGITMTANPGGAANGNTSVGSGGTASGGNTTNTTGTAGTASVTGDSGAGGAGANGGSGGPSVSGSPANGDAGTQPGGGGSGSIRNVSAIGTDGGGGGGYSKSVFTFGVTSGFPAVGSSISWTVPGGTAGGVGTGATTPTTGGNGAAGQVRFTIA